MPEKPWNEHNGQVAKKILPPSATLSYALNYWEGAGQTPGNAADLGCGTGIDTLELLRNGWSVLAIDHDQRSIEILEQNILPQPSFLTTRLQSFENLSLPTLQLINASHALPFCKPRYFDNCWATICQALQPGGIFCGHFFGIHDDWSLRPAMTFHRKEDMATLFSGFDLLRIEEIEKDGPTISGMIKHWHLFTVIARALPSP